MLNNVTELVGGFRGTGATRLEDEELADWRKRDGSTKLNTEDFLFVLGVDKGEIPGTLVGGYGPDVGSAVVREPVYDVDEVVGDIELGIAPEGKCVY